MAELTVYHIPVCPFCQRLEILLALKGLQDRVRFVVIDITQPAAQYQGGGFVKTGPFEDPS